MRFGVAVASDTQSWRVAKRAEALGFESIWFYDTQLLNPDVFVCMALAAHETERIRLGTGVLIPTNRIEPVAANGLASLNRIAPGRIDFGVGTGFTGRRTMGLSAMPLGTLKTYVERVRALLGGETVTWDFEGQERKIRFLNPDLGLINLDDPVPLYMSAMGPRARRVASALGAGWLNFGGHVGRAVADLEDMKAAWRESGRAPEELGSTLFFLGAVLTGDPAEDERRLMQQAAPATAVAFHDMLDASGTLPANSSLPQPMADTLAAYREVYETYEPADARYLQNHRFHLMRLRPEESGLLSPDLVRATTLSGTQGELVDRLRLLADAGYDQLVVQVVLGEESALDDWARVFEQV